MLDLVKDTPYVVDMHTAPEGPPFAIIVKRGEEELRLVELMGIRRIVPLSIIKDPHSLIGFARCGAGVELVGHREYSAIKQGE